jgi:hypothetical protein
VLVVEAPRRRHSTDAEVHLGLAAFPLGEDDPDARPRLPALLAEQTSSTWSNGRRDRGQVERSPFISY